MTSEVWRARLNGGYLGPDWVKELLSDFEDCEASIIQEKLLSKAIAEDREKLVAALTKLRRSHYVCEDCWYSCPASGECCNDGINKPGVCTCGANDTNAIIDAALASVGK